MPLYRPDLYVHIFKPVLVYMAFRYGPYPGNFTGPFLCCLLFRRSAFCRLCFPFLGNLFLCFYLRYSRMLFTISLDLPSKFSQCWITHLRFFFLVTEYNSIPPTTIIPPV